MKRITACVVALAALALGCNSLAIAGIAQVTIIDRDTGAVLTPHYYHGEYWVAGRPGAHYSVEIHNRLGERVMAVTSVDGVNVISGETANWDQTGYVLDPDETCQITGWRKSDTEVAAFTFTESSNSYAELTGRPANVGVIGVAVFRERPAPRVAMRESNAPPADATATSPNSRSSDRGSPASSAAAASADTIEEIAAVSSAGQSNRAIPAPTAPAPANRDSVARAASSAASSEPLAAAPPPTSTQMPSASAALPRTFRPPEPVSPKLGTGHGDREYSFVTHVDFTRRQDRPNEVIRIRYDSLDNLIAMGIIPRPRPHMPTVDPFPGSPEQHYVPDPPTAGLDDGY